MGEDVADDGSLIFMIKDPSAYWLIDTASGSIMGADTTAVVPAVQGALAYDVLYDPDAAIEYASTRGIAFDLPDSGGVPASSLQGFWAIDTDTGFVNDASGVVIVPAQVDGNLSPDAAISLAEAQGKTPEVSEDVRDIEGLPFESVTN